jgi:hypothetical protein
VVGFIETCLNFLLFSTMIPVSLIISINILRLFLSYFIDVDDELKNDDLLSPKFAEVLNYSVVEELG